MNRGFVKRPKPFGHRMLSMYDFESLPWLSLKPRDVPVSSDIRLGFNLLYVVCH